MSVAPTYRGVSAANCTGATNASFTTPASSAQGDLRFIIFESSDSTTAAGTPNTPSGWTSVYEQTVGSGTNGCSTTTVFAQIAPSSPGNVTVDGVLDHLSGRMLSISAGTHGVTDVSTDLVVGTKADHGVATSTLTTTGITVSPNSMILWIMGLSDDASDTTNASAQTNANLASITERWDNTVATGAGGGTSVCTATCAGTTTGNGTWDHDTAERSQSVYIGVKPAPVTAVLAAPLGVLSGTAAATPTVNATLAAPLGTLTGSAAATPNHPATLAAPLGAVVAHADATVTPPGATIQAVLDAPLGSLVAAAAATPTVPATLAAPLGTLTGQAAATPNHPATLAAPLGTVTGQAAATPNHPATLAAPLGAVVAHIAAIPVEPAVLNAPLGSVTAQAAATPNHPATLAAPLGSLVATANASVQTPGGDINATLAAPLGGLTGQAAATATTPDTPPPAAGSDAGGGFVFRHPQKLPPSTVFAGMSATCGPLVAHASATVEFHDSPDDELILTLA